MSLKIFLDRTPILYMSHANIIPSSLKYDRVSPLNEYIQEMVKNCDPSSKLVKHISTKLLYIDENALYYYMDDPSIGNESYSAIIMYKEPEEMTLKNFKNKNIECAYTHELSSNTIGKVKNTDNLNIIIQGIIFDINTNILHDHKITLVAISKNVIYMIVRHQCNTILIFDN